MTPAARKLLVAREEEYPVRDGFIGFPGTLKAILAKGEHGQAGRSSCHLIA